MKHDLSHLMVREIQAPMVAKLIRGFAEEIGSDKALGIAKKIIEKDAVESGKMLAKQYKGNTLAVLSKIIREVWAKEDSMEINFLRETEDEFRFDVTRCGYADAYEKLGIKDLGCIMSCCRDFAFMDGFNPAIKLRRNKTLMEGDDCCDFHYVKQ